jgi:hypothetical protein
MRDQTPLCMVDQPLSMNMRADMSRLFDCAAERRLTERRITERQKTEWRITKGRITKRRMTEWRKN